MHEIKDRQVFIAVLDWGMGHATRMKPVIQHLAENNTVILGVTSVNDFYFQEQFPLLKKVTLPSYGIRYSEFLPVWLKLILDWPGISRIVKSEQALLPKIISENKIDLVISDSRFGLFSKDCESIIVSHQLQLKTPFQMQFAARLNKKWLERFHEIWVPDYEDGARSLAGKLSRAAGLRTRVSYIGPQSALLPPQKTEADYKSDLVILLSGPEPQRSILENLLVSALQISDKKIVLLRGTRKPAGTMPANFRIIDFCQPTELAHWLHCADTIICRSGYSSLMDLHALHKKKIILIPTPGQSEQEYLAFYWKEKFEAVCLLQKQIGKELSLLLKTH